MTRSRLRLRHLAHPRRSLLLAGPAAVLAVVLAALWTHSLATRRAVAVPSPVYDIEARSQKRDGTPHTASLLNLKLGQPGAPQAPVPVDIDGDLVPDVMVEVNLVFVEGALFNPPQPGQILAPNIRVSRIVPGAPLSSTSTNPGLACLPLKPEPCPSPPLEIKVKLTINDSNGGPATYFRFGYDTRGGGSIPTEFQAVVSGLDTFFNPMQAVVDTKSSLRKAGSPEVSYEGPLALKFGLEKSDKSFVANGDAAYRPWPDAIRLRYASDDTGEHLAYAHGISDQVSLKYNKVVDHHERAYVPGDLPEIDLRTVLAVKDGSDTLDVDARVDRLPRALTTDFRPGRIDYAAKSDGRLPDVGTTVKSVTGGKLLNAKADIEGLPPELHGLWNLGVDGNASARFTTVNPDDATANPNAGRPLGAVEARVSNYEDGANPAPLVPFVPTQRQHVSYQRVGGDNGKQLIQARLEKVRDATFALTDDGVDAATRIGDGVLPLELNVETDELPGGDALQGRATVSPLPDTLGVKLRNGTDGDLDDPFVLDYSASSAVDVVGHFETRTAQALQAACGFPGTICADVDVRHLPESIVTTIRQAKPDTIVEIDARPRAGGVKPDVFLNGVLGKQDGLADPALADTKPTPLIAAGEIRGIPPFLRIRAREGADETLQNLDFFTCELTQDGNGKPLYDTGDCQPGTQSPVEEIGVKVRNFLDADRPAGMEPPAATAPNLATIQARGLDETTETVRFEAAGRILDLDQVRYLNGGEGGLFGLRARAGGGKDLQVVLDVQNVDFEGDDPANGRIDVTGRAMVTPLPTSIDLCVRQADQPLGLTSPVPFTTRCQNANPFGDVVPSNSPITFAYDADTSFDVDGAVAHTRHGSPATIADERTIEARFVLDNVPAEVTAHVLAPGEKGKPDAGDPVRILTKAPGAANFDVDLHLEDRRGGADCDEPAPAGQVSCVNATVDDLPQYFSVLAVNEEGENQVQARACDFAFFAPSAGGRTCRPGTAGQVGELKVDARLRKGEPAAVAPFVLAEHPLPSPAGQPAPYFLEARIAQQSDDDLEMKASGRFAQLRSLTFAQGDDGFDMTTDLGDNKTPLLSHVALDSRTKGDPADPEDDDGELIVGDARVVPLPQTIAISQRGPGSNQVTDPLRFTYTSSAQVDLDAEARIIPVDAGGEACGASRTACASLDIDRLPARLEARVGNVITDFVGVENRVRKDVAFDLDLTPQPGQTGAQRPDLTARAVLGERFFADLPALLGGDGVPLVAEGTLQKLPDFVRVRLRGYEDFRVVPGEKRESVGQTVERFEIHTCDRDFTTNTCTGTPDELESLTLSARNFLLRPADFPHPTQDVAAANYAVVRGRGTAFEAAARLVKIKEAQYVRREADGVVGIRTQVGGGGDLLVHADVKDLDLGVPLALGDLTVSPARLDFDARARVDTLPAVLDICFRQGGTKAPLPAVNGDFTDQCQDVNPFDATPATLTDNSLGHAPMSISYRSGTDTPFNVYTAVAADVRGSMQGTNIPIAPRHLKGRLDITGLPGKLEAHVLTPRDGEKRGGPLKVLVDSLRNPGDPLPAAGPTIDFAGEMTLGDAICGDPRVQIDVEAYCAKGKFANLPSVLTLNFDPDKRFDNFDVQTKGAAGTKMDWTGLEVSAVRPVVQNGAVKLDDDGDPVADILLATGALKGVSRNTSVTGSLALPEEEGQGPAVDLSAQIAIDEVQARVQNFIAPDPFPAIPPRRTSAFVPVPPAAQLPEQLVAFQQEGEKFKVDALIKNLRAAKYRTVVDADGKALDTQVLGIDFGQDQSLRAFADIRADEDDPGNRVLADVLLGEIPAGIDICFRGRKTAGSAAPIDGGGTFCDNRAVNGTTLLNPSQVEDDEGAIEVRFRSASAVPEKLDVDAELRMSKDFESDIIAARAQLQDIPHVIRGTIPAGDTGDLDVQLLDVNGAPDGIGRIEAEFATFDIFGTGWAAADLPYSASRRDDAPFPAEPRPDTNSVDTGGQYAAVRVSGGDIHARARLGTTAAGAGSNLQRLQMRKEACPRPTERSAAATADYPYLPLNHDVPGVTGGRNDYLCIGAAFTGGASGDHLAADVVVDTEKGERLRLQQAGLTDVPGWFQMTYAGSPANGPAPQNKVRRPCGRVGVETSSGASFPTDCVPPLVRFDQGIGSGAGAGDLYGMLEFGRPVDLEKLDLPETDAREALASPDTAPGRTGAGWNDVWASNPKGARLKLLTLKQGMALRAGVRLTIPGSVTIDAPATWERAAPEFPKDVAVNEFGQALATNADKAANWWSGTDIHVGFVSRDASGNVLATLGQAAGVIHNVEDKSQLLLNGPCAVRGDIAKFLEDIAAGLFGTFVTATFDPFSIFGGFPSAAVDNLRNLNPLRITQQCAGAGHQTTGFPIPGEVKVNLFLRSDKFRARDYVQVDGRISDPGTPMAIGMRMLGDPDDPGALGRLEAQAVNLPTTAGIADESRAAMRLRLEMKGEPPTKEDPNGIPSESDPEPEDKPDIVDLCGEAICFKTEGTRVESVFASLNFRPTGQPVARRIDALVEMPGKTTQGIELAGYTTVTGTTETPVGVVANARINPLTLEMRDNFGKFVSDAGDAVEEFFDDLDLGFIGDLVGFAFDLIAAAINELVQLNLDLDAIVDAQVNLEATKHFDLKHNTLHIQAGNAGPKDAVVGPIDIRIRELQAVANLGITIPLPWPLPDIPIGVTLLNIFYVPSPSTFTPLGPEPMLLRFYECGVSGIVQAIPGVGDFVTLLDDLRFPNLVSASGDASRDDVDVVAWPLDDPRIVWGGALGPFLQVGNELLAPLIAQIFCLAAGYDDLEMFAGGHPADAVGGRAQGHPITTDDVIVPGPGYVAPPPPDLAPVASILAPTGGATVKDTIDVDVSATDDDTPAPLTVELRVDNGSWLPMTRVGTTNSYRRSLDTTTLSNGSHTLRARVSEPTPARTVESTARTVNVNNVPPPPPPPDLTLTSDMALCGTHTFRKLVVPAGMTLRVATAFDTTDVSPTITADRCAASSAPAPAPETRGTLSIIADDIEILGTVDGFGVIGTAPPANVSPAPAGPAVNGGAGHAAAGGAGKVGDTANAGGAAYGNTSTATLGFTGSPANGATADPVAFPDPDRFGRGGGAIFLNASNRILVDGGLVSADGGRGRSDTSGDCGQPYVDNDPPGAGDEDQPFVARTGGAGNGGGSAGTVSLAAPKVELKGGGKVLARGGAGGDGNLGGGGGGSGGTVKISAPVFLFPAGSPDVSYGGGAGGTDLCADDGIDPSYDDNGTAGGSFGIAPVLRPSSSMTQPAAGEWYRGAGLEVGYAARGAYQQATGFNVVVCAQRMPISTPLPAPTATDPDPLKAIFTLAPVASSVTSPCGGGQQLAEKRVLAADGVEVAAPDSAAAKVNVSIGANPGDNGFWGLYSVALRPRTVGNDCRSAADDSGFTPAVTSDADDCQVEAIEVRPTDPSKRLNPDVVIRLDNTPPARPGGVVTDPIVTSPEAGTTITRGSVQMTISVADQADLSGLKVVECRNGTTGPFQPCQQGAQTWVLSPGDGTRTVQVRATDNAGNVRQDSFVVNVDQGVDDASAELSSNPNAEGWYNGANLPAITLVPPAAPNQLPGLPLNFPYLFTYHFDKGADAAPCIDPCPAVPTSGLTDGRHTFHYTAIDLAGNRYFDNVTDGSRPTPMQTALTRPGGGTVNEIRIDRRPPTTALLTVPALCVPPVPADARCGQTPLGADYWFTTDPWVVLSAVDQFGASGVDVTRVKVETENPAGSGIFVVDPARNDAVYTAPFKLGPGVHRVSFFSEDVADNVEARTFAPVLIRVDGQAPSMGSRIEVPPANGSFDPPDGLNGWYVTEPVGIASGFSDGLGVGGAAQAVRERIDNGPERACADPCTTQPGALLTGEHLYHASAVDKLGNRRSEALPGGTRSLKVDLVRPRSYILAGPAAPDGRNGWYHQRPWLTVAAVDTQPGDGLLAPGSGVASVEYRIAPGAYQPYTGPFLLGEGTSTVCVRATDKAGWTELDAKGQEHCETFQVDLLDPTAAVSATPTLPSTGWYVAPPTATVSAGDPGTGSGVGADLAVDLCSHLLPDNRSGTCVAVDGRPFVPVTGPLVIGEGEHVVESFSVDRSGRRSALARRSVQVDLSPPVSEGRLVPPFPASKGWWRTVPRVVLRAFDGDENSGVVELLYGINTAPAQPYKGTFSFPGAGDYSVNFNAIDAAGLSAAAPYSKSVKIDLVSPVPKAGTPSPQVWLKLLNPITKEHLGFSPATAQLNFTVSDDRSSVLTVRAIVFNETGAPVRYMEKTVNVMPGKPVNDWFVWDGKDQSLAGAVPAGIYHFRIVAIDEAGNPAMSGESAPLQVKVG